MKQLNYLLMNEKVLPETEVPQLRELMLEDMDKSDWRIHPTYGCLHKDVYALLTKLTHYKPDITNADSECALAAYLDELKPPLELTVADIATILRWKEGVEKQSFQTHSDDVAVDHSDLINQRHRGRLEQSLLPYKIPLDTLVEVRSIYHSAPARGYVCYQGRDCDGNPCYGISLRKGYRRVEVTLKSSEPEVYAAEIHNSKIEYGYSEESLTVISQ